MKLSDLVARSNGTLVQGDGAMEIVRAANIEIAQQGEIAFVANPRYEKFIATTKASAIIISEPMTCDRKDIAVIRARDPYVSFVKVLYAFAPKKHLQSGGIHPTAVVPASVHLGKNVSIGPYVVVSERVTIGNNTTILPHVVIGNDVHIGSDVTLYPNVVIREECVIGNRVVIESGTVIGSDGFGYAQREDGSYEKIPQLGRVVIEDDVAIGASCTVDRATMGDTRICRGAKLDNLIQIAHNVVIGEHTVIAAQAGVSGSAKLGSHNMVGGQAGFTGHIETVARVVVGAQSGVSKSIMKAGTYFGYPARDLREALKHEATLRKLPQLLETVTELEEEIKRLKEKN